MFALCKEKSKKQEDFKKQERDEKRQKFREILEQVERICAMNDEKDLSVKIGIYDFCIEALTAEVSASSACQLLYKKHCPYSQDFMIGLTKGYQKRNIKFKNFHVVACVWNTERWVGSVRDILKQNFCQSEAYYAGILYEELELIVIYNGLHHTSIASLIDSGSAEVQCVRLSDYYEILSTDGADWFRDDGVSRQVASVGDYRMAVLYELSRQRAMICNDARLVRPTTVPTPHENSEYYDRFNAISNERNYYRNESELLSEKVRALEAELQSYQTELAARTTE